MQEPLVVPLRDDPDARFQLVARMLQIRVDAWEAADAAFVRDSRAGSPDPAQRLAALADSYARYCPHAAPLPSDLAPVGCCACGAGALQPLLAREPGPIIYGRCDACGHGALLARAAPLPAVPSYRGPGYYQQRSASGVGYDAYAHEAAYRESKGERLVTRLLAHAGSPIETLLEVGSGYGYTRRAAEWLGLSTTGVELNPYACAEAQRRYGLATFAGDLEAALAAPDSGIEPGGADAVLYQYVLEHVRDVARELRAAACALRPGGLLALLVPSMDAAEIAVFGASYRSFRADHEHLFSLRSIALLLHAALFDPVVIESFCNLHLLHAALSERELLQLYADGRGPDLFVLARKVS